MEQEIIKNLLKITHKNMTYDDFFKMIGELSENISSEEDMWKILSPMLDEIL